MGTRAQREDVHSPFELQRVDRTQCIVDYWFLWFDGFGQEMFQMDSMEEIESEDHRNGTWNAQKKRVTECHRFHLFVAIKSCEFQHHFIFGQFDWFNVLCV